jgi:hypothetical protein
METVEEIIINNLTDMENQSINDKAYNKVYVKNPVGNKTPYEFLEDIIYNKEYHSYGISTYSDKECTNKIKTKTNRTFFVYFKILKTYFEELTIEEFCLIVKNLIINKRTQDLQYAKDNYKYSEEEKGYLAFCEFDEEYNRTDVGSLCLIFCPTAQNIVLYKNLGDITHFDDLKDDDINRVIYDYDQHFKEGHGDDEYLPITITQILLNMGYKKENIIF